MTSVTTDSAVSAAYAQDAAVAPIYTFDCRRADGSPICLEAHELSSDVRALAWGRKLLKEHLTCSSIEVFEGERRVGAVAGEQA